MRLITTNIAEYSANKDDSDHQGNRVDILHAISHFFSPLTAALSLHISDSLSPQVTNSSCPHLDLSLFLFYLFFYPPLSLSGHQALSAHVGELIGFILERGKGALKAITDRMQARTGKIHTPSYMHPHIDTYTHAHHTNRHLC